MNSVVEPMTVEQILEVIRRERVYQDAKWGSIRENPHPVMVWLDLMAEEWAESKQAALQRDEVEALREVVQLVAVGLACLEQHGAVPRKSYRVSKASVSIIEPGEGAT